MMMSEDDANASSDDPELDLEVGDIAGPEPAQEKAPAAAFDRLAALLGASGEAPEVIAERAVLHIANLQSRLDRPQISEFDPAAHNILREVVLEAERRLRNPDEHPYDVADFLAHAARASLDALDEDDILVDFDAGPADNGQLAHLLGRLGLRSKDSDESARAGAAIDPVDTALLRAIALRDEIAARTIAASETPDDILTAYRAQLLELGEVIAANSRRLKGQD